MATATRLTLPIGAILGIAALLLLPAVPTAHAIGPGPAQFVAHPSADPGRSKSPVLSTHGRPLAAGTVLTAPRVPPGQAPREDHPKPSAGSHVNPFLAHSAEPASMGVADFGVTGTGSGASGYAYSTDSLQANALVHSMSLSVTSGSTTTHVAAFELNAVIVLQLNGTNYSYWIQNGLHVDTSSNQYTIGGAYVWNFSSPTARLAAGELRGNASSHLVSDTYYFIPGCGGFPGQCSTLTLPENLTARITLATCGSFPCVDYEYNLGAGWVTYDSVSFLHMSAARELGFVVDGFRYTPLATGTYYDAEWVWVAAGGGSSGRDVGSNLNLTLEYSDGQGYRPVPNAWNFGGDTGESSFNITETLAHAGPGWVPGAHLASGSGSLGVLYNGSSVGTLNVTAPVRTPANLTIDGLRVPFANGTVDLTMVSGTYAIALENFANASVQFLVKPGQTNFLNLSGAGETVFSESTLPAGTLWGVTVGGMMQAVRGTSLFFNLPNGTYSITYAAVPGWILQNTSRLTSLVVPSPGLLSLVFAAFFYSVPVNETGLPAGTNWSVSAEGSYEGTPYGDVGRGNGTILEFNAPNGTFNFTVTAPFEFIPSPNNGTFSVEAGASTPLGIQFSYRPCYVAGSVAPTNASLTLDGVAQAVAGGDFNVTVLPGRHTLTASAPGFVSQTVNVTATPGNVTDERISLEANPPAPMRTTNSTTASTSGPDLLTVVGIGVGVVAVAGVVTFLFMRRRSGSG